LASIHDNLIHESAHVERHMGT